MAQIIAQHNLDKSSVPPPQVQPASPTLQLRLMGMLTRSIAATNMFPLTLHTIRACVFGTAVEALDKELHF